MRNTFLFSAPGRTELSGNHTDHQHKINTPDWPLLLPGLICGLVGVILGLILSNHTQNTQ